MEEGSKADTSLPSLVTPIRWVGRPPDERFAVSVHDTGPGIEPDMLLHIFERFYRGQFNRGESGTGSGLAIAKALAEAQNGTIALESHFGQGSVFTVTLPRVVVHGEAENTANAWQSHLFSSQWA